MTSGNYLFWVTRSIYDACYQSLDGYESHADEGACGLGTAFAVLIGWPFLPIFGAVDIGLIVPEFIASAVTGF